MGLFQHDSAPPSCPIAPSGPQYGSKNVAGSMNFHQLTVVLSGAFAAFACLVAGWAFMRHALHFSRPAEQTKILRIIALVPVYAIISFLSASFPTAALYLQNWADFYESIALASFFVLLVVYVAPVPETRETFFNDLEEKSKTGKPTGKGSSQWYHRTWLMVFQYIPVSFLVSIATDASVATGTYCLASNNLHYAHIWLTIIKSISVALAFMRILFFYKRLKSDVKQHKAVAKLLGVKGIVFLSFLQSIIFTILHSTKALEPNSMLSYDDITFGIPNLLLCIEMVLFAVIQLYAYDIGRYKIRHAVGLESQHPGPSQYHGGLLGIKAIVAAANPMDIILGLVTAVGFVAGITHVQQRSHDVAMKPLGSGRYSQYPNNNNMPPSYAYQQPLAQHQAQYSNVQQQRADTPVNQQLHDERWT